MLQATLTSQNQITIPAYVRAKAGLKPGDRILFMPVGDKFEMEKAVDISDLTGIFKKYAKNYKPYDTADLWTERYRTFLKENKIKK
jgi:AbrB family looped-hinge helix DNA binding protein